ncbi:aspartate aminotransferase family protein [Paracoccaceae bacterium Fryx2]|nr:aspartate aminotransferase family protein [Paracoccaceae bacterium Fryx2]
MTHSAPSHIFHRNARQTPPRASHAAGIWITDTGGRRYLDACGGAAVSCLGHGDPEVVAAIANQAARLAYVHTSFFTTDAAEDLANLLIAGAPEGIARAYFLCDGSEAVETALKMAHQYHRERGEPDRCHIIAREQSYHGNTLGALSAGGNALRRATYQGVMLPSTSHIAPCWDYRLRLPGETPEAYGRRAADLLEAEILRVGPGRVSCFIAETVVGATLGCVPPAPGYFARIREICDRHGVLLILDEVMCGMGRTGTLHACEAEAVRPDILVVAKGLGAGYVPLGAVLCSQQVFDAFAEGSGGFVHGHTFVGHPVACAAALAVQRAVQSRGLVAQSQARGCDLRAGLEAALGGHRSVGDIRGRGLFQAVEFVADRGTKAPFDAAAKINARIRQAAMDRGLLVYAMAGTLDGRTGDHILLAPPFITTPDDIALIVDLLAAAVTDALPS